MTGDEVIRALRAEPGFDGLPILILSGEPISHSPTSKPSAPTAQC